MAWHSLVWFGSFEPVELSVLREAERDMEE
jgi:hypothetical protein